MLTRFFSQDFVRKILFVRFCSQDLVRKILFVRFPDENPKLKSKSLLSTSISDSSNSLAKKKVFRRPMKIEIFLFSSRFKIFGWTSDDCLTESLSVCPRETR